MKNSVPYARFRGKKERIPMFDFRLLAFPLLLASLIVVLCGCDKKASDASSDRRASENAAPIEAQPTEGAEAVGTQPTEGAEAVGTQPTEGGEAVEAQSSEGAEAVEAQPTEGGEAVEAQPPEGGEAFGAQSPEGAQTPAQPSANDELTIRFNGLSGIVTEINEKMKSFDDRLTQILKMLEKENSGVSTPVLMASLLLFTVLNVILTAFVIRRSTPRSDGVLNLERKINDLEKRLDEQRKVMDTQTQALQTLVSQAASQESLNSLKATITEHTRVLMAAAYPNTGAQKAQAAATTQSSPKKEFYQAFPPHSSAEAIILEKSRTIQPIVGWLSASGTLILEPYLGGDGKCSRDNLYGAQMTACFAIQPSEPVNSSDFYTVDIRKNAEAIPRNGRYELSLQGQLVARR